MNAGGRGKAGSDAVFGRRDLKFCRLLCITGGFDSSLDVGEGEHYGHKESRNDSIATESENVP